METTLNRKRRGHFTKGKQLMMSIYKGTMSSIRSSSTKVKPSPYPSPAHHHVVGSGYNTNVVMNQLTDVTQQVLPKQQKVLHRPPPTPTPPPHHHHLEFIVNQDQVVPNHQSKQKVFVGNGGGGGRQSQYDSYNGILHDNINYNKLYGVAVDESVDIKAATYISTVRERLWLH